MMGPLLVVIGARELVDTGNPGAHAVAVLPKEQPSNDNDISKSIPAAMPTVRQRLLLNRSAITSLAQRLLRSPPPRTTPLPRAPV